jgi:hypothetical protein
MRCLLLVMAAALAADELHLRDGRVVEGDVSPATQPGMLDVVVGAQGFTATLHIAAAEVREHRRGDTPRQARVRLLDAERARLGSHGGDAATWWRLAEGYRREDLALPAKHCARQVVQRAPDHAEARAYLGQVRHEGRWMTMAAAAAARGEVFFRGRWMPAAARDAILADEAATVAREAEAQRLRHEQALARLEEARRRAEIDALRQPEPAASVTFATVVPYPSILWRDPQWWLHGSGNLWGIDWDFTWRP